MKYHRPFSTILLFLLFTSFLLSQEQLLKVFDGESNDPRVIGTIANSILFDISGEMWISGGTTETTVKLLDPEEGHVVAHPRAILDGKYYFIKGTSSGDGDFTLYEVDPSIPSIRPVLSDINDMSAMVAYNGLLYLGIRDVDNLGNAFVSLNPANGALDVIFETGDLILSTVFDAIVHDSKIILIYRRTDGMDFLASTNGVPGNVDDFYFFESHPTWINNERRINMTAADDQLFFWYTEDFSDIDLYVTDGTTNGTQLLKGDFGRNFKFEYDVQKFRDIVAFGDRIYFDLSDEGNLPTTKGDLWTSDGTESGTVRIRYKSNDPLSPGDFTILNDELYFIGDVEGYNDQGIFKVVDDTEVALAFNEELHQEDPFEVAQSLVEHKGKLYFGGFIDFVFSELYRSRGTLASISKVSDIEREFTVLWWLHSTPEHLYFFHIDDARKVYLFRYDAELCILSHNEVSLSLDMDGQSNVSIAWDLEEQEGISELRLSRSNDLSSWEEIADFSDPEVMPEAYLDESPALGSNYYRLYVTTLNGYSYYSKVEVINYESDIMFPFANPVMDKIDVPKVVDELRIYDISGKLLKGTYSDFQGELDIQDFRSGIYILDVMMDKTRYRKRILKL